MSTLYTLEDTMGQSAQIKVIGVGGGGGNAVAHMISNAIAVYLFFGKVHFVARRS